MAHTKSRSEPIRDPSKVLAIKNTLKSEASPRDYLLFVLGLNTALRLRDLLALRVGDVIDSRGRVRNAICPRQSGLPTLRGKLNASCRDALRYYISETKPEDREALLFCSTEPNRPMSRTQVWRLINEWCHAAGLVDGRYGSHTLRKTWGYMALKHCSIPIGSIQAKYHHATPGVTKRYLGVEGDKIDNVEAFVNL